MSAPVASDRETARLANIAARLASPFEGERAAAALLGTRDLETRGETWSAVIERGLRPVPPLRPVTPPLPKRRAPSTATMMARLRWLIEWGWGYLNDREGVLLIRLYDAGGPFGAADVEHVRRITQHVEAASGCRAGQEIPL